MSEIEEMKATIAMLEEMVNDLNRWTRADEDRVYGRLNELKDKGEEWIILFKKLNADRMDEILALKTRLGVLEKMVVEPQAQALVDRVGSSYRPIAHDCPHCKRPMK